MTRLTYAVLFCITSLVSQLAFTWLIAGSITTGVAERLPAKNATGYVLAFLIIAVAGGWTHLMQPRGSPHRGLEMATVARLVGFGKVLTFFAVARFTAPLISTRFGSKPDLQATLYWSAIVYVGAALVRIAPVFLKHALPTAEEILQKDPRRPILYLRSFSKEAQRARRMRFTGVVRRFLDSQGGYYLSARHDGDLLFNSRSRVARTIQSRRTAFDEQIVFAQAFEQIGPYIAIGRPQETFQEMDLGAAKKYVTDDEWQQVVRAWLQDCAAVVLDAGDSASLGWEIEQVVHLVPATHVLVICPYTDTDYAAFRQVHGERFPRRLPRQRPTSRLLIFDDEWNARELPNVNCNATDTLVPFFAQLGTNLRQMPGPRQRLGAARRPSG